MCALDIAYNAAIHNTCTMQIHVNDRVVALYVVYHVILLYTMLLQQHIHA